MPAAFICACGGKPSFPPPPPSSLLHVETAHIWASVSDASGLQQGCNLTFMSLHTGGLALLDKDGDTL